MKPALILATQGVDGLAFAFAVSSFGINGEANPLVGWIFASGGLLAVLAIKLCGAVAAASIVSILGDRHPLIFHAVAWLGIFGAATALLAFL